MKKKFANGHHLFFKEKSSAARDVGGEGGGGFCRVLNWSFSLTYFSLAYFSVAYSTRSHAFPSCSVSFMHFTSIC